MVHADYVKIEDCFTLKVYQEVASRPFDDIDVLMHFLNREEIHIVEAPALDLKNFPTFKHEQMFHFVLPIKIKNRRNKNEVRLTKFC